VKEERENFAANTKKKQQQSKKEDEKLTSVIYRTDAGRNESEKEGTKDGFGALECTHRICAHRSTN